MNRLEYVTLISVYFPDLKILELSVFVIAIIFPLTIKLKIKLNLKLNVYILIYIKWWNQKSQLLSKLRK